MWIPYTDHVVVVKCNETTRTSPPKRTIFHPNYSEDEKLAPLRELLMRARSTSSPSNEDVNSLSATQLRDELIRVAPLSREWIAQVNAAEAEFWKRSKGYRIGWSDEILGFDCGGQQWVLEVAFPTEGTASNPTTKVCTLGRMTLPVESQPTVS
jgi:L-galactono-1,4-lactone dehydrogenase